jgi:hypothetical protein
MQNLKKLYRSNYAGENIITNLTLQDGEWNPETEFVPNAVTNTFTTNQAVVLGNGTSRANFDLRFIANHQGGLLGENRLQSYGCNALYKDFTPDFLVVTSGVVANDVVNNGYCNSNIVYSSADMVTKYPGKFYLIPQNVQMDAGANAAYMACFDGHTKVFLMGFDHYQGHSHINNVYAGHNGYPSQTDNDNGEAYVINLTTVINTYPEVDFVRVMSTDQHWMHDKLKPLLNLRQISYRDFVLEADIGTMRVLS